MCTTEGVLLQKKMFKKSGILFLYTHPTRFFAQISDFRHLTFCQKSQFRAFTHSLWCICPAILQIYRKKEAPFLEYIQVGDYYVLALKVEEEPHPIGRWGRLYRTYLQEQYPITFNTLLFSGKLYHRLADINEEATERLDLIIRQMQKAEGISREKI